MDLSSLGIGYLLFTDGDLDGVYFHLTNSGNFHVNEIKTYLNGVYGRAVVGVPRTVVECHKVKEIAIFPLLKMGCVRSIVKYQEKNHPVLLFPNGTENPLNPIPYNTDASRLTFIAEHFTFAFSEQQTYTFPEKKEDLSDNMILEYYDGNKWVERKVMDVNTEYEKMYRLLLKYKKIRVPSK